MTDTSSSVIIKPCDVLSLYMCSAPCACMYSLSMRTTRLSYSMIYISNGFITTYLGSKDFVWNRYLKEQDAEAAPKSLFQKVQITYDSYVANCIIHLAKFYLFSIS